MSIENFSKMMDTKVRVIFPYLMILAMCYGFYAINDTTTAVNTLSTSLIKESQEFDKRITKLEDESYTDAYERGRAGLISLQNAGLTTVEEIEEFYSIKPAGRMDMKQACRNTDVVNQLNVEFDGMMTTTCTIFN